MGIERLVDALDIEELDQNLYRAGNLRTVKWPLFGGQVAAQALVAAARTVPEGRLPHSMHGYFLRAGSADHPVILKVDRDRDGGSYSARHVVAVQQGEVIFDMTASFQVDRDGPVWPAEVEPVDEDPLSLPTAEAMRVGPEQLDLFEIRANPLLDGDDARGIVVQVPYRIWLRPLGDVPDDPIVRAAIVAYISDLGSGVPRLRFDRDDLTGGPSLDHSVWFLHPVPLDDWILIDHTPWAASTGRGLYHGVISDRAGRVCTRIAQEHLIRIRRPDTPT